MFEELDAKYDDFCWFEIQDEYSKTNLEKQAKLEISDLCPLYEFKDKLVCVAKSERQDDVLFYYNEKYYVIHLSWNNGINKDLRYKELLSDELSNYFESYYQNV